MKTTIVPAQITTVEDKVAGNLSFTQLLLMITPLFLGGGVFVLLPPIFGFSYFKLLICSATMVMCLILAIRIKGKILLQWMVILSRYALRPRLYLFNKNDSYLRQSTHKAQVLEQEDTIDVDEIVNEPARELLPVHQLIKAEHAVSDPNRKFHLRTGKGGLQIVITEVKKEGI